MLDFPVVVSPEMSTRLAVALLPIPTAARGRPRRSPSVSRAPRGVAHPAPLASSRPTASATAERGFPVPPGPGPPPASPWRPKLAAALLSGAAALAHACNPPSAFARADPRPIPTTTTGTSLILPVPPAASFIMPDLNVHAADADARSPAVPTPTPPPRKKMNAFVRDATRRVAPSVVRIDVDFRPDAIDRDLLPDPPGVGDRRPPRSHRVRHGQGCGVVYDQRRGLVITNAHVVEGRGRVRVTFTDGRARDGVVVGVDHLTDVAVVRVPPERGLAFPEAPTLGDSSTLEVGDWVIALGNPFGLDNTITLGIVSNLRRTSAELGIPDRRVDFVQTDCAINPGNSGGPLMNEFGEVIAMNTAVRADAEGIGFAIPINDVRKVVEQLAEGRRVPHPRLGVQMVTLDEDGIGTRERERDRDDDARSFEPASRGVLMLRVFPDLPAAAAGIRAGDVCVAVDGVTVEDAEQIQRAVADAEPGQTMTLTVARGDARANVDVRVADSKLDVDRDGARVGVGGDGSEFAGGEAAERLGDDDDVTSSNPAGEIAKEGVVPVTGERSERTREKFSSPPGMGLHPRSYEDVGRSAARAA